MSDIADFLRARLLERRALAEAACHGGAGNWRQSDPGWVSILIQDENGDAVIYDEGSPSAEQAAHIVANDPETVIADCDAKLALVDLMDQTLKYAEGDTEVDHYGALGMAEETLHRLAQPFAGHPDHKGEEWAPQP